MGEPPHSFDAKSRGIFFFSAEAVGKRSSAKSLVAFGAHDAEHSNRKGENVNIRKLHRSVGLMFAPFFLITALTGMALLWRKAGVYGPDIKNFLIGIHNWEIAARYIGVILAAGLIFMVVTGSLIFIKLIRRKH